MTRRFRRLVDRLPRRTRQGPETIPPRLASLVVRKKPAPLDAVVLKTLLLKTLATADEEISCDDCVAQLDRFVELSLAGRSPGEALPLVRRHLEICLECSEEFELLLEVVKRRG